MRTVWFALLLGVTVGAAHAVDVRGRVDFLTPNGAFPMARAAVRLCLIGGPCTNDFWTGNDGMYYFQGLSPGWHAVLVNGNEKWRFNIPNTGGFDIPPVRGN